MHFEEYGFDVQAYAKASITFYFGGNSGGGNPYYDLTLNVELDAIKLVPYKQIFFFTRPWDIDEPAGQGPMLPPGDDSEGSTEGSEDDSWDDEGSDDSWDDEGDDSWDDEGDDSWDDEGDDSFDDESARLQQDGDSWDDEGDSWDDSLGDDSWSSWDDSEDLSWDDSTAGSEEGSSASEEGSGEGQGFHMFVGGAYDFEVGKFFVSYCESAYTGTASIWTIGSSTWTNTYAVAGSNPMTADCWMDPELVIELNDMLPHSIAKMLGEVEIYEIKLF